MSVETLLECVTPTTGEGPHWEDSSQTLIFVDILDGIAFRWDSKTGKYESYKFDTYVSFIVPCRKGGYLIGLGKAVAHFDWDTKKTTILAKVEEDKNTRFNDGKCDASGRLWCGTMAIETAPAVLEYHQGALYSFELDGTLKKQKDKVSISNGLAWSADNKTMYYIDSIPRKVWAYDFDLASGKMSNERAVVDFGGPETLSTLGFPDGMTIDTEGKIWVACYNGGKVVRFDPETGKELKTVAIPARRTTSCCWGGRNLDELFITCGRTGMTEEEKVKTPLAGSVFKVTGLGFKGAPAYVYEGQLSQL